LACLQELLPTQGRALEIASGTGQHVALFGAKLPGWTWQPSDLSEDDFPSISLWCQQNGAARVLSPCVLDVMAPEWPRADAVFGALFDVIYCANMLHIAPWACSQGLMQGAARHLAADGRLITYGPYLERGVPSAPSNLAFDASLRERDPAWGIRWLHEVQAQAELAGLRLSSRFEMPANNLLLVFERSPQGGSSARAAPRGDSPG
jgi:SAM-dependent methyltransferase